MSLEKWQAAIGEIPDIIAAEPSENKALLLAALYVLQPHLSNQGETPHPAPETAAQGENEATEHDILVHINDELSDANTYYNLWIQTKEPTYKEFSRQELSHSEWWFKQARQAGIAQTELQDAITMHGALAAKLT